MRAELEDSETSMRSAYVVYGYMWLCVHVQMLTRSLAPVHLLSCAKCEHLGRGLSLVCEGMVRVKIYISTRTLACAA